MGNGIVDKLRGSAVMYSVIVVDDEILVREAICENINWNLLGFELAGNCENGKSAIEFLKKNEVDVVLTDICPSPSAHDTGMLTTGVRIKGSRMVKEKSAETQPLASRTVII